jgi:hypothetical protein
LAAAAVVDLELKTILMATAPKVEVVEVVDTCILLSSPYPEVLLTV